MRLKVEYYLGEGLEKVQVKEIDLGMRIWNVKEAYRKVDEAVRPSLLEMVKGLGFNEEPVRGIMSEIKRKIHYLSYVRRLEVFKEVAYHVYWRENGYYRFVKRIKQLTNKRLCFRTSWRNSFAYTDDHDNLYTGAYYKLYVPVIVGVALERTL